MYQITLLNEDKIDTLNSKWRGVINEFENFNKRVYFDLTKNEYTGMKIWSVDLLDVSLSPKISDIISRRILDNVEEITC